ncbi:solute carrier family 45 member 3 [Pungitius pungitius]|uniref:solute carrier family 45 member 3 n=1 Tax=Pungitius pungitius TaxID=134920 RepID=UPI002E131F5F
MGSMGLFLQCATSTFFSLIMSRLVRHFGFRWVYMSSMVSFTVSAFVICISKSVLLVTIMTSLTGYAYATLQSLPYTLTCMYHKEKEVYMPKRKTQSSHKNGVTAKRDPGYLTPGKEEGRSNHVAGTPYEHAFFSQPHGPNGSANSCDQDEVESGHEQRGVGLDFAILDSTFLLSQVFPTLFMGMIVQLAQSVTAYIACSAVFGTVAIYLASRIVFEQKDLKN